MVAHKRLCRTPSSSPQYKHYGGRGIEFLFSDSYVEACEQILSEIGPRPGGREWTIDRIDNDGPYGPGNIRWATMKQQQNNKRRKYHLTKHQLQLLVEAGHPAI